VSPLPCLAAVACQALSQNQSTITQPAGSTVLEFKTVTTKKGKTDSLRNIKVDSSGGKLSDPLKITGEARLWYFEAVFPVELRDSAGRMLGLGPAQAQVRLDDGRMGTV
jgi:hypothetical protein